MILARVSGAISIREGRRNTSLLRDIATLTPRLHRLFLVLIALGRRGRCFAETDLMMNCRFWSVGMGTFAHTSASAISVLTAGSSSVPAPVFIFI
jgi:hypothetical protein